MIDYDDSLHRYSFKGERYISATQLLEHYKTPFDTEGAALYVSERRGGSSDMWKQQWKEKNKMSLIRGQSTHDLKEGVTINRMLEVFEGKVLPVPNKNLLKTYDYSKWPDGFYTELLLWNHQFRIAGRADRVIFYKGFAYIHDYKTNELIRSYSYWDPKTKEYTMLKYPLNHIMQCTLDEYTLQLSIYMFMLEEMGFRVGWLSLEHIPHIPNNAPPGAKAPKPVITKRPYMKKDVLLMLNHLRA